MPHFGKLFRKHDDYFIFCHFAFLLFGLKAYPAMHPMTNIGMPQLKNAPHIFTSLLPVEFFPYCPRHAFVKIPVHIKPRSFLLPAFFPLPFLLPRRYIGDKFFSAYHGFTSHSTRRSYRICASAWLAAQGFSRPLPLPPCSAPEPAVIPHACPGAAHP